MLMSKLKVGYAVAFASAFVIASVGEVKARTAIGQANVTVISEIASMPILIRMQTPQLNVQNTSAGVGFASNQISGDGFSSSTQPSVTLIGIDAAGVATFSVSGAATSGYVIRSEGGGNTGVQTQTVSPTGTALTAVNATAGLIVPAQALIGGGRLSIEISQASTRAQGGNLIVEINYN